MLNIKLLNSIKGSTPENEDVADYCGEYMWVIDGATDLYDIKNRLGISVSETVNIISDYLKKNLNDELTLKEILKRTMQEVRLYLQSNYLINNFKEYELPTFAMVFCRLNDNILEYLIFADCYLIYDNQEYFDERFMKFVIENKKINDYKKEEVFTIEDRIEYFRKNREKANNGYWVGSISGKGIEEALTGEIELLENKDILLMSDGFYHYYIKSESVEYICEKIINSKEYDIKTGKKDDASIIKAEYINSN